MDKENGDWYVLPSGRLYLYPLSNKMKKINF